MKKLRFILFMCLILTITPYYSVQASSNLRIKMNGSVVKYEGTQAKAAFDGKGIDVSNTPGIIVNGIALFPYDVVFKNGLGIKCQYNTFTKVLTMKKNENTVKLTMGSSIAYVNGTKKTLSVSPRKVYFYHSKKTKLMVPSRFVTEALGYTYNWNASKSLAEIRTPYALYYDKTWHTYTGTKGSVKINGASINVSDMPTVVMKNIAFVQAKKVFGYKELDATYQYNSKSKTITIRNDDLVVEFTLDSTTAYVNGKRCTLKVAPKIMKDNVTKKSAIMVPAKFTAESLGYGYVWNSSKKISEIAVIRKKEWSLALEKTNHSSACTNTLQSIDLIDEKGVESIRFVGKSDLSIETEFSKKHNTITLSIANLNNIDTKLSKKLTNSNNLKQLKISECETGNLTITMSLSEDATYYEEKSGNRYCIYFCNSEVEVDDNTILLQKPEGVSYSDIMDTDCYYNKQFKITIPGDQVSYYNNISLSSLPEGITSVKCSLNSSGNTVLTFHTTKVLGYKLFDNGDTFGITVGRPSEIYDSIVLLDAGHGGVDPGCVSNGQQEKNINYNIIYKYARTYFNGKNSKVKAYWTRTTDKKIELSDRAAYSEKVEADVFISLHMNSAGSSAANGTETYYTLTNNKPNSYGLTSKMVANYFQSNWSSQLGLSTTRGVKTANYVVTKQNTVPAILIELGFMTSTKDISILGSSENQKKAAKTFYQTVCNLFEEYPTGR
nr:N-acetylmuramoyl-L-alanine amidase [uncultured Lachnoclostridium sp.]